jgi:hypothetical protein
LGPPWFGQVERRYTDEWNLECAYNFVVHTIVPWQPLATNYILFLEMLNFSKKIFSKIKKNCEEK